MNLDELSQKVRGTSSDPAVQSIANYLVWWKDTPETAESLADAIEHLIGNSWISSDTVHEQVYTLWSAFRTKCIKPIAGMTMNERLYCFSLFERFDAIQDDEDRREIYAKVHAREA